MRLSNQPEKSPIAVICLGLFFISGSADAASTNTVMAVTALSPTACAITALPLAFGTLSQLGGAANESQTSLVVTCTPGTGYNVGLDAGTHALNGVRRLQSALDSTSFVPYYLYTNTSRSTEWGNVVGTDTVSGTAGLLPTTLNVYGRIPANAPLVSAGAYLDTVTVTITF